LDAALQFFLAQSRKRAAMKPGRAKLNAHWKVFLVAVVLLESAEGLVAQTTTSGSSRAPRKVVVSLSARRLVVLEDGRVLRSFPIAVGADRTPSPTGAFAIVNRVSNPIYYHAGQRIPPGKASPIGTRWIGLSKKGYGIHGTNAPRSIGKAASHGCIRLRNRDMEQLFTMLRAGDRVEIRGEQERTAQVFGGTDQANAMVANSEFDNSSIDGGQ
jgi:lipoprotein-anchoring transpeptidase ErfK/SrfK